MTFLSKGWGCNNRDASLRLALNLLALITVLCVFVPFNPAMPVDGLDNSWGLALNEALVHGWTVGRDLIFTYGPYTFLYTQLYSAAKQPQMLVVCLYFAAVYWVNLSLFLNRNSGGRASLWAGLALVLLIAAGERNAQFLAYIFIAAFNMERMSSRPVAAFWLALILTPLGLLPLVKGSMLVLCVVVTLVAAVLFVLAGRRRLAALCLTVPVISLVLFWAAAGQEMALLPDYFAGISPIISGYGEAMAIDGFVHEPILFVLIAVPLMVGLLRDGRIDLLRRLALLLICSLSLFLCFKAGFIRHDGHAVTASNGLTFIALLLYISARAEGWNVRVPLLVAVIGGLFFTLTVMTYNKILPLRERLVAANFDPTSLRGKSNYEKALVVYRVVGLDGLLQVFDPRTLFDFPYAAAWDGIANSLRNPDWKAQKYQQGMAEIRQKWNFPLMGGTADIYSFNQFGLVASGNGWNPRPVFQSYSVYAPYLSQKNRQHLVGPTAPDTIFFSVEAIDGNLPALEDGASWPLLLQNYRPFGGDHGYLYLRRTATDDLVLNDGAVQTHALTETVTVPTADQPLFAVVDIQPSLMGKILSLLYKPSLLQVTLTLKDGSQVQYRMVSGMAKSGFIISPLVANTDDFALLYGPAKNWEAKQVVAMTIDDRRAQSLFWKHDYTVRFTPIPLAGR